MIFWVKICFNLLKGSIFELQNCNIYQKKGHFNLHILHYCWKMCKIVIAHRKPKNAPHIASFNKMGSHPHIATCYRTSQLATCDRTSQVMPWSLYVSSNIKIGLENNWPLVSSFLDSLFWMKISFFGKLYDAGHISTRNNARSHCKKKVSRQCSGSPYSDWMH